MTSKEAYNFLYGTYFKYFERLWGKGKDIVKLNVTIAISFSTFCLLLGISLILYSVFHSDIFLIFSSKLAALILGALIYCLNWYYYEHNERFIEIVQWYEDYVSTISPSEFMRKKSIVYTFMFGSVVLFMVMIFTLA